MLAPPANPNQSYINLVLGLGFRVRSRVSYLSD